ncbi:MAG: ABC transporter permease [Alphaproteobacteria bacterium]|nr:ABC transporter permease [Alphaproteobacteria bacterium]
MSFDAYPSLRRMWAIMIKELKQLRRDRGTFAMIVMIPIVQLLLFGYAINTDPKNMPTAILSQDNGPFARGIVAGLKNSSYFDIVREAASEDEARLLLQQGKVQFVVSIPENFGRDIVRGDKPSLLIEADATDPTASAGALGAVGGVLSQIVREDFRGALAHLKGTDAPYQVQVHKLYNPEGFSRYNIVPGLMGIVLTMTGVMMTAMALTRERERGTMENLLSMPVRPIEVMAGKILPYVGIGYLQAGIIVFTAKFLFGVPIIGSLWLLSLALIFFIVCNLALGFTMSSAAQNQMQAMQMSMTVLLPSILLSGYMFPFAGMPVWARIIGDMLPVTYFMRIVRSVLLKGSGFVEIWPHLWPMFIFMILITALAMKLYRKTLD